MCQPGPEVAGRSPGLVGARSRDVINGMAAELPGKYIDEELCDIVRLVLKNDPFVKTSYFDRKTLPGYDLCVKFTHGEVNHANKSRH